MILGNVEGYSVLKPYEHSWLTSDKTKGAAEVPIVINLVGRRPFGVTLHVGLGRDAWTPKVSTSADGTSSSGYEYFFAVLPAVEALLGRCSSTRHSSKQPHHGWYFPRLCAQTRHTCPAVWNLGYPFAGSIVIQLLLGSNKTKDIKFTMRVYI